jgi:hypothetical protein
VATVPAHHIITQNNISNSSDFAVQISCRRLRMFMEGSYIMPFGHWPFGMDKGEPGQAGFFWGGGGGL